MAFDSVCVKHSTVLNRILLYDGISVLISLIGSVCISPTGVVIIDCGHPNFILTFPPEPYQPVHPPLQEPAQTA